VRTRGILFCDSCKTSIPQGAVSVSASGGRTLCGPCAAIDGTLDEEREPAAGPAGDRKRSPRPARRPRRFRDPASLQSQAIKIFRVAAIIFVGIGCVLGLIGLVLGLVVFLSFILADAGTPATISSVKLVFTFWLASGLGFFSAITGVCAAVTAWYLSEEEG